MKYILLIILIINSSYVFADYNFQVFKEEISSPYSISEAHPYFLTGLGITSLLVLNRDGVVEPFQRQVQKTPLFDEKTSQFGDLMGQLVPNILYMGGQYIHYKYTNNKRSLNRSILMLKASLYAGGTTTILKRIVNEERPDKGDRLSFPSGHSTTAFAFASVVAMEHEWYYGALAYSLASVVAMSRINDNVHYLHDVVFGATIGITYGVSLYYLQQKKNSNIGFSILPYEDGLITGLSFRY